MLDFDLTSVLMAVITSNVLIIILVFIFFNESALYKFGFSILGVFCVLVFVRMVLPFELASITKVIMFPKTISKFIVFITHPRFSLFGYPCSIWTCCIAIWGIVFLVLFFRYIHSIKKTYDFVMNYGKDVTDDYRLLVGKLCINDKLCKRISVIRLPLMPSPSVFKYGSNYYILIPKNLELDEEETELVFKHELAHIFHHDSTLKFLIQVLCLFYWWNPFCSLLKKKSDLLFELRVDSSIITKGPDEVKRYLACLIKVREYSADNQSNLSLTATISLLPVQNSALYKRFYFLTEDGSRNKYLEKCILIPVCIMYLASFIFIFEPYYRVTEDTTIGTDLSVQNMYIIKHDESTYDIYFNGVYAETVDSLDNYPEDCKIYLSLEEAQQNEEN